MWFQGTGRLGPGCRPERGWEGGAGSRPQRGVLLGPCPCRGRWSPPRLSLGVWRQGSPHARWVCKGVCVLKVFGGRAGLKQLQGKDRTPAQHLPVAKRAVWGIPADGRAWQGLNLPPEPKEGMPRCQRAQLHSTETSRQSNSKGESCCPRPCEDSIGPLRASTAQEQLHLRPAGWPYRMWGSVLLWDPSFSVCILYNVL